MQSTLRFAGMSRLGIAAPNTENVNNPIIVCAGMYYHNPDPAIPDDSWLSTFPFDVDNWQAAANREALEVKVGMGGAPISNQPHAVPVRCRPLRDIGPA